MDLKSGQFNGVKVAAPDGPLLEYFEQGYTRMIFYNLFWDPTIDAVAKKAEKRAGEKVTPGYSVTKTTAVTKPPYPIWYLNQKEIETFFSNFKSELAKEEGVKLRPKSCWQFSCETSTSNSKLW